MCGLVLKFGSSPETVQNVTYALDKMKHRGTQTSTVHCFFDATIGHVRLPIINIKNGIAENKFIILIFYN